MTTEEKEIQIDMAIWKIINIKEEFPELKYYEYWESVKAQAEAMIEAREMFEMMEKNGE